MTNAADDKRSLRHRFRSIRKAIPQVTRRRAARAVARQASRSRHCRHARRVAVYLSMGSELSTAPLIAALQSRGITVFVPALTRSGMYFRQLNTRTLRRHASGMLQPCVGVRLRTSAMDVLLLPLLGFDAQGTRLGQGGGHYDRALSHCRFRPYRIGLGYAAQKVRTLPCEPWDQRLNAIITERGLQRFPRNLS